MKETSGKKWIIALKKRWIIFSIGRVLLFSVAISLVITTLSSCFFQLGAIIFLPCFILLFFLLSLGTKYWLISETDISRYIDLHIPAVEESSSLLLKPIATLSFLEQLQAQKVNTVLQLEKQPSAPLQQLKLPVISLIAGIVLCLIVVKYPRNSYSSVQQQPLATVAAVKVKENIPAKIASIKVRITPPAYTRKPVRVQEQFTLVAESGATINWEISTSQSLEKLSFIFNDNQPVQLKKANQEGTLWAISKKLFKSGFYQIEIAGKRSDFYQAEVIADQPVAIKISKPLQHSTIDIGQPQQVNLSILMQDDYGITDAHILATMASGKGEAVSFKEKKITFNIPFNGKKSIRLDKLISLNEMGMKPGDELYFYVQAKDNHDQVSRSDMYFVSIQDTTELMSMAGIDNGVNLVPEYFRSERQIIIDTEKLLKDKASISEAEFKKRSNDLGIDQKMLRLRYGKFLGEESETSIGAGQEEEQGHQEGHEKEHDHEKGHHHNELPDQKETTAGIANVQSIMDQYAHKHDTAEDATFFEPQLKAQLKATLTEMWNAELRLRTYRPAQALPYEYKALRLLKDLQQKSRAYVAKSTFKTTPLKLEKRLTGELIAIKSSSSNGKYESENNHKPTLKQALGLLESSKDGQPRTVQEINLFMQAQQALLAGASAAPAQYLPAIKALKKIINAGQSGKLQPADIAVAENGINHLIGQQLPVPNPQTNSSSSALTRSYFDQLKRLMH